MDKVPLPLINTIYRTEYSSLVGRRNLPDARQIPFWQKRYIQGW